MVFFEDGQIFMFGGRGNDSVIQELNDLWAYDIEKGEWVM